MLAIFWFFSMHDAKTYKFQLILNDGDTRDLAV